MSIEKHNDSLRREYFAIGASIVRLPAHELAHTVDGSHGPEYFQMPRHRHLSRRPIAGARWRLAFLGHLRGMIGGHGVARPEQSPLECRGATTTATCSQDS